jgi:hypothetical protein
MDKFEMDQLYGIQNYMIKNALFHIVDGNGLRQCYVTGLDGMPWRREVKTWKDYKLDQKKEVKINQRI